SHCSISSGHNTGSLPKRSLPHTGQISRLGDGSSIPPNERPQVSPTIPGQWAKTKFWSLFPARNGPSQVSAKDSRDRRNHREAQTRTERDAPKRTGSPRSQVANNSYRDGDRRSFLRGPAARSRESVLQ